ncbi:MAG TPA: hypothetical protein VFB62_26595 [Polyangiaceae bacterium]|jgi:hypothetical protein|nr:hypothetical protein [Polyangiaceae bacterium]
MKLASFLGAALMLVATASFAQEEEEPAPPEAPAAAPEEPAAEPEARAPEVRAPEPPAPKPKARVVRVAKSEREGADVEDEPVEERPAHRLGFEFGTRLVVIQDASFDPYAENDLLPQAMIGIGYMPFSIGPAAFGIIGEYDVGTVSADARGVPSSLLLQRMAGGVHAQIELWRFQLYARAMPGAIYAHATLDDDGVDRALASDGWTWVMDVSGGARFRLASADERVVDFWLFGEGGYSLTGDIEMAFAPPVEENDPRSFGQLKLPALHPSGGTARFGFALSFL